MGREGPGGAATSVTGGLMGGEGDSAECNRVSVVQDAVDAGSREGEDAVSPVGEVFAATGADDLGVAFHDHVLGVGLAENLSGAGHVIVVSLSVEEDFGVLPVEAETFDAGADLRRRAFEIGVDEDVSCGRGDEVGGEVAAAYVVEVVGDLERGDGGSPVGVGLGMRWKYQEK